MSCDHSNIHCYDCGAPDCPCPESPELGAARARISELTELLREAPDYAAANRWKTEGAWTKERWFEWNRRRIAALASPDAKGTKNVELGRLSGTDDVSGPVSRDSPRGSGELVGAVSLAAKGDAPECHTGPLGPCDLHPTHPDAERLSDAEVSDDTTFLESAGLGAHAVRYRKLLAHTKHQEGLLDDWMTNAKHYRERAEAAEKEAARIDQLRKNAIAEIARETAERQSAQKSAEAFHRDWQTEVEMRRAAEKRVAELGVELDSTRVEHVNLNNGLCERIAQLEAQLDRAEKLKLLYANERDQLRADLAKVCNCGALDGDKHEDDCRRVLSGAGSEGSKP